MHDRDMHTSPSPQFDFFTPHCECDPIDIEGFNAIAAYRKNPGAALYEACGTGGVHVDLKMLKVVTTLVVQEKSARSLQLAETLIRMIVNGYTLPPAPDAIGRLKQKRCHWELPLVGIYNTCLAIRRDSATGPEDGKIVGCFCGQYERIVKVIMQDLPKLLPAGPHADHLRNTFVKTTAILAEDPDFRE